MGRFFLPRKWRFPKVVLGLIIAELPFTVANLALFGIAHPNTYRDILWRFGGERGFNSDPSKLAYAAYNHREMEIPLVWSSLNTNYNMYMGVVCMFFWLIKVTLWCMGCLYPIIALVLHIALAAIWSASIYIQTAPDTADPEHQNKGAPWYITKNCNIVPDKKTRGYCEQAKSAFAVSVCMLVIYVAFICMSIWSLVPTPEAREKHEIKRAEKKAEKELYASEPYEQDLSPEQQWQHMWELQQLPRTPGTAAGNAPWSKVPVTPRTHAFNELQGGGQPEYYTPEKQQQQEFYASQQYQQQQQQEQEVQVQQTYYPPPPQRAADGTVGYAGVAPQGQQDLDEWVYDGKGKGTAV